VKTQTQKSWDTKALSSYIILHNVYHELNKVNLAAAIVKKDKHYLKDC